MISIILTMYNEEESIERMLTSISNQTYQDYELILINDGSTDHSEDRVQAWRDKDSRIRYFYHDNQGIAYSRNRGISLVKGDYIAFLDADDYIEANYLEKMYQAQEKNSEVDLVICSFTYNGQKIVFPQQSLDKVQTVDEMMRPQGSKGYLWNKLFKSAIIRQHQMVFDQEILVVSDLPFSVEYVNHCRRVYYISDILIHYHYHDQSISNNFSHPKSLTQIHSISKCVNLLERENYPQEVIEKYLTFYFRVTTGVLFKHQFELTEDHKAYFKEALNSYPINRISNKFVRLKYYMALIYLKFA